MTVLEGSRIVLAVTGGIAAYKAADLASKLVQAGATVDTITTASARLFVGDATFQALTKRPVHGQTPETWTEDFFGHITLGHDADVILVAPATANSIARLAHGLADDLLGAVALSSTAPLIVVPAMEHDMFHHPATQANLQTLVARGAIQVGPERGRLASGGTGDGRMPAVETIVGAVRKTLGRNGPLRGLRIVISAGGTQEQLDPVRFLGNRSSGLMGYALAEAAVDAGAEVRLVSGPTPLAAPFGTDIVRVETAEEMLAAVREACRGARALVMAAAVADYRPHVAQPQKIKKGADGEAISLALVRNPDILASIDEPGLVKIGFAAETNDLIANATKKLNAKGLAMIVANDAAATIGSQTSTAHILIRNRPVEHLRTMSKTDLAAIVIDRLVDLLDGTNRA